MELTSEQLSSPNKNRIIANKLKGLKAKIEGTHKGSNNSRYGKEVKKSTREKLRVAKTGQKHTDEAKRKSARPGKLNGFYGRGEERRGEKNTFHGKTHSKKVKERLKNAALNRKEDHHCIHCDGYFTAQAYKQHHGDRCPNNPNRVVIERKKKVLSGPQTKLTCPHCGFQGGEGNMKRYHMDECEFKEHYIVSYLSGKKYKVYQSLFMIEGDKINWHKVRHCLQGKSKKAYKMEWKKVKR